MWQREKNNYVRIDIETKTLDCDIIIIDLLKTQDMKTGLYDIKPWNSQEVGVSARTKATLLKGSIYQVNTLLGSNTKYKSLFELEVREFIIYTFSAGLYLKEIKY